MSERFIHHYDLRARLHEISKAGVAVPHLRVRPGAPVYFLSRHGRDHYFRDEDRGQPVIVPEGHVIDRYGNVVNLRELEHLAWATKQKPSSAHEERRLH